MFQVYTILANMEECPTAALQEALTECLTQRDENNAVALTCGEMGAMGACQMYIKQSRLWHLHARAITAVLFKR